MSEIEEIRERDGPELRTLKAPVQRAAYSDRTAWQMAVMAELAYVKFETATPGFLKALAHDLAEASGAEEIEARLKTFHELLKDPQGEGRGLLAAVLEVAGFELVGVFFNQSLDPERNTEGFVAKKIAGEGRDFAVLSIRGTTSFQDWKANVDADLLPIGGDRLVHSGFYKAFQDAEPQMRILLEQTEGLPLFITGHSLGGAVAVMATWVFKRDTLGACYTFGAPRVGNHVFNDSFHTPIYRIVNAFDPVPMVPPTNKLLVPVKVLLRLFSRILPGAVVWDFLMERLLRLQGYRHAGDLRFMTEGDMDSDGRYPTVEFHTHMSFTDRFSRMMSLIRKGELKRLDLYHVMATYRRKLRHRALDRAPKSAMATLAGAAAKPGGTPGD